MAEPASRGNVLGCDAATCCFVAKSRQEQRRPQRLSTSRWNWSPHARALPGRLGSGRPGSLARCVAPGGRSKVSPCQWSTVSSPGEISEERVLLGLPDSAIPVPNRSLARLPPGRPCHLRLSRTVAPRGIRQVPAAHAPGHLRAGRFLPVLVAKPSSEAADIGPPMTTRPP